MRTIPRHQCMIYQGSAATTLPGLAATLAEKLMAKKRCLFLNSPPVIGWMQKCLAGAGVDVPGETAKGALVLSSDQGHLSGGRFDTDRMLSLLGEMVDTARADGFAGLWAAGDMTWEFGAERDFDKLLDYEQKLERLFARKPGVEGICLYHVDTVPAGAIQSALQTHRAVYINETLSRVSPWYVDPFCGGLAPDIPDAEVGRMLARDSGAGI